MREDRFLESLSRIVGDYDLLSTSTGRDQRTDSRQLIRHRIFDDDEFAAMPKGRGVVIALRRSADPDSHPALDDRPAR